LPQATAPIPSVSFRPILIPQFADGGGWQTQLLLVNPTDVTIMGAVQFGTTVSTGYRAAVGYSIPPRSSTAIQTPGASSTIVTGAIVVTPDSNNYAPVASTVFSFAENGVTVTQNGVVNADVSTAFRVFAEMDSGSTSLRTGLAIANSSALPANVQF